MWGRQIICAGSRWRIGNGQDVHIHKANWILKPITFKPVIKPTMPYEALVSELINGENYWDENLIYRHFDKMDADVITQICCQKDQGRMNSSGIMVRVANILSKAVTKQP